MLVPKWKTVVGSSDTQKNLTIKLLKLLKKILWANKNWKFAQTKNIYLEENFKVQLHTSYCRVYIFCSAYSETSSLQLWYIDNNQNQFHIHVNEWTMLLPAPTNCWYKCRHWLNHPLKSLAYIKHTVSMLLYRYILN